VTALDWPTLRALIDGEHVAGVVAAVNGLDDRQRRALAGPVRAYARERSPDPSVPWEARQRGTAALRVAGAGCLSGADAVAHWLTRADLQSWGPGARADDAVLEVLRARRVPWLPELARRLVVRQRDDRWDGGMWRLVAALVTATGIEPPATDGFVRGWMWASGGWQGGRAGRRLVDVLRHDPFLAALGPRLFEVDRVGGLLAWSASAGAPAEASWPRALATMAAEGRLERAMLLDRCLGRLLRGGPRADVRGFLLLHQALDPDLEEVATRARDYARLLADGHANVAAAAQQALRRADDAGRLELGLLLEASRAVLFRPEDRLVRTQLSWLEAIARRQPGRAGEVLGAASVAFGHERAELQARAVSLIGRHARLADPAARAELLGAAAALPADLRHGVAAALGGEVPADGPAAASWPALAAPTPPELPPPIGTPAELAEELAAALVRHAAVDPVALERLLAALVTLAHADPAALRDAVDPVVTRYQVRQGLMLWSPTIRYDIPDEHLELRWAAAAAVARPRGSRALRGAGDALWNAEERNWHCALTMVPAPRRALLGRLHELAVGLWRPPPLLLATPTTATWQLDPGELVARLERTVAAGCEPWDHDLQQAMLRLPPGPHTAAADRARRLGSPAGRRLAGWLAGGGLPHPGVARRVHTTPRRRPYWPPSAPGPVVDEVVSLLATVTPPPGLPALVGVAPPRRSLARRLRPEHPPLARLLCELPAPEHWQQWEAGWLECWPAVLPCHRDVVAAHLLPWLGRLPSGARGAGRVLPLLAEADGPAGPGLTIALAHGLGARDQADRSAAVDALLVLAGRGQLNGAALGAELGALSGLDAVQVGRVVPGLRDLARAGAAAEVWAIVAAAIPGMLPPARERPPRGLPDLMALGAEVAGAGGGAAIPELAAITGRAGSSRLIDASRRLERVLAGAPVPG
jgi:hypothetical protein